ncbi:MAG TPA: ATP synthase F1 subunit delta [Candidatus Polarisedimenticolia bacterium]|nr:ATP synthase F1 subunit delta [Candidatus Polarisedimenticolia bacterium]
MAGEDIGLNYATALIDALGSGDEISHAVRDLEAFGVLLKQVPALIRVLDYPGTPLERRKTILDEALASLKPQPKTRTLLHLVLENGRMRNIGAILAAFRKLSDNRLGMARAEVVTVRPIDAAARKGWEEALGRLSSRKVQVEYRTDPTLLGGAIARIGTVVYDGSLRKQLAKVREVLLG